MFDGSVAKTVDITPNSIGTYTKAEIESEIGRKMSFPINLTSVTDFDKLNEDGLKVYSVDATDKNGANSSKPINTNEDAWYNVISMGPQDRKTQIASQCYRGSYESALCVRTGHDGKWNEWQRILTDKSLEITEYPVPFRNGFSNYGYSVYYKNASNQVFLYFECVKTDGDSFSWSNNAIADLPVGYRPKGTINITSTAYQGTLSYTTGYIQTNGAIIVSPTNSSTKGIRGYVSFLAE